MSDPTQVMSSKDGLKLSVDDMWELVNLTTLTSTEQKLAEYSTMVFDGCIE